MIQMLRPSKCLSPIGVDLGETAIRACQIVRHGREFVVTKMAKVDLSKESKDTARADIEKQALQRCIEMGGFKGRSAAIVLHTPDVRLHAIELPKAEANMMDSVVHFEIQRLTGQELGDLETRYWRLPAGAPNSPTGMGAAASLELVTSRINSCERIGLDCLCVDVDVAAVSRVGAMLRSSPTERTRDIWGVLDLGGRSARLTICVDDVPVNARPASGGGEVWTEQIASALDIGLGSAEIHKREHGISLSTKGEHESKDVAPKTELGEIMFGALRIELHNLASEIKRSFEYVLGCYPGRKVSDLILVGGGSGLSNLNVFLSDALGIDVRSAADYLQDSGCQIRFSSATGHCIEDFSTAIGAALGGLRLND